MYKYYHTCPVLAAQTVPLGLGAKVEAVHNHNYACTCMLLPSVLPLTRAAGTTTVPLVNTQC